MKPHFSPAKIRGLEAMLTRGGTTAERERAAEALTRGTLRNAHMGDTGLSISTPNMGLWTAQGVLMRTRNGTTAYLRQTSLTYFLANVQEGVKFTYKSIRYVDGGYGSGDFYVIRDWLLSLKLMTQISGGYIIRSIHAVREAWNNIVRSQMFI